MKKKRLYIGISVAVGVAIFVVVALLLTFLRPLSGTISAKGYTLSVPSGWTMDENGVITDKKGTNVGNFTLAYDVPDLENSVQYAGVQAKGDVVTEQLSEVIFKNTFESEFGLTVQYFICGLPNPEPYAANITLFRSSVGEFLGDRIAASFSVAELGSNPPPKNISSLSYDAVDKTSAAKLILKDGTVAAKNVSELDLFIKQLQNGDAKGLNLYTYEQKEDKGIYLSTWHYLEADNEKGYLYTYYDKGEGFYTYDNNPIIFQTIEKKVDQKTGITTYQYVTKRGEMNALFEIPANFYRDNAEALLMLQTAASDKATLLKILEKIMTEEELSHITVEKNGENVFIQYDDQRALQKAKIQKDAAVLFRLAEDIKTVTVKNKDGKEVTVSRESIMQKVTESSENATKSPEDFAKFVEEIEEKLSEKIDTTSGSYAHVPDGQIIYSGTVVMYNNSKVKHPRTGKIVSVGPYAKKMGYEQYLGKPITCTIRKSGKAFLATATYGGSVIAATTLNTEALVHRAIETIKAYS